MKVLISPKMLFFIFLFLTGVSDSLSAQNSSTPDFKNLSFLSTSHQVYVVKNQKSDSGLLIIYFRTDCDDCRKDAQIIKNKAKDFPVTIWMVSPNDLDNLSDFEYMTGLMNVPNVKVLQDNLDLMHKTFSFRYLPFGALFSSKGNLVITYNDLPDAAQVKKDLRGK